MKSLRCEEETLGIVLAAAKIGSWCWDVSDKKGFWSPKLRRMLGMTYEEAFFSPMSSFRLIRMEDRAKIGRIFRDATADESCLEPDCHIIHANGEIHSMPIKEKAKRHAMREDGQRTC